MPEAGASWSSRTRKSRKQCRSSISGPTTKSSVRALGLGCTFTTRHLLFEKESEAALRLPPGVHSYAILPIGYPMGTFGPVGRGSLGEFVYEDNWGQPATWV